MNGHSSIIANSVNDGTSESSTESTDSESPSTSPIHEPTGNAATTTTNFLSATQQPLAKGGETVEETNADRLMRYQLTNGSNNTSKADHNSQNGRVHTGDLLPHGSSPSNGLAHSGPAQSNGIAHLGPAFPMKAGPGHHVNNGALSNWEPCV